MQINHSFWYFVIIFCWMHKQNFTKINKQCSSNNNDYLSIIFYSDKIETRMCLIRVNYIDQAIPTTISRKPNTYRITWIETWTKKLVEPNDRNTNSWREMAWNAEGVTTKEMNMKKDGEREMDIYLVVAENWAAWDKGAVHPCPRVQARAQKLYPSQSLVGGHPSRPRPLLCSQPLSTTPRYLHLGSHPRRNPSLSRSTDHFNLHYVRPRIAEGSIKFLLSRAAFSKAAKAYHQRTRHLSNGLSALSRVAPWPRIIYLPAANPRNCFSFLVTNHGKTCKQQDSSIDTNCLSMKESYFRKRDSNSKRIFFR